MAGGAPDGVGTVSCAEICRPQPTSPAIQAGSSSNDRSAGIRSRKATWLSGVRSATAARKLPAGSPRAASAAATATAMAPAAASGWACVTAADNAACPATRSRSSASNAPSGATRIAAPFPHEPVPSNWRVVTARQSSPAPMQRRTSCMDPP
jgi:hypothetical protein